MKTNQKISVPLISLSAQHKPIEAELMEAIQSVVRSGHFILGPHVTRLETRIAELCLCDHAVGVSSGSDALLAALMALEIGPGDEIITTPFTFFATSEAILRVGAKPLFCDISSQTFNLSPEEVRRTLDDIAVQRGKKIVNRHTGGIIRGILPVHLYGQLSEMAAFAELAKEYGLYLIEDAAQSLGVTDSTGTPVGYYSDIGCLSFHPTKCLGALGDGGMCVTRDPELADKLRLLRSHGSRPKFYHLEAGGNFRLDELQAAALLVKMNYLAAWTTQRQNTAATYDRAFKNSELLTPLSPLPGYTHVYGHYVIKSDHRDRLRQALSDAGIGTAIYYPYPLHTQPIFNFLKHEEHAFPEAVKAAQTNLAIPVWPGMTEVQQEHIISTIQRNKHG